MNKLVRLVTLQAKHLQFQLTDCYLSLCANYAMMSYVVNELERVLVRLYIEKAMLEKGIIVYNSVCEHLYTNYNCFLEDCCEHPEYLVTILKDIHGSDAGDIISSIKNDLREFYNYKRIASFLDVLNNVKIADVGTDDYTL